MSQGSAVGSKPVVIRRWCCVDRGDREKTIEANHEIRKNVWKEEVEGEFSFK